MAADDDALKKGDRLSKALSVRTVTWSRPHEVLATDVQAEVPIYVGLDAGSWKTLRLCAGGEAVTGTGDAQLVFRTRSGEDSALLFMISWGDFSIQPWTVTDLGITPQDVSPGEIITVSVQKSGGGILLPALILLLDVEIS